MLKKVFSSAFLVRIAHVILTWVVTLILFLQDTDLRKQEAIGEFGQPILFLLLVLASIMLYFTVSLMDPGFVHTDAESEFSAEMCEERQEMIPQSTRSAWHRRCGYCLLLFHMRTFFEKQPMRARHCQICRHCVRRYDHHCPWIENCVGEKNHRWFVLYLAVQLLTLLWGFHVAWSGFTPAPAWKQWLWQNGFLLAASCVVGVFSIVLLLLLGSHLYLVSVNTTTWEFMSYHRISYLKHHSTDDSPFDQGMLWNTWGFFCAWRTVAWEQVYTKGGIQRT